MNDIDQIGTFGFIRLSNKKCLFIAKGYFDEGQEAQCNYWLMLAAMSNREKTAFLS